jgi:hypothetical protein
MSNTTSQICAIIATSHQFSQSCQPHYQMTTQTNIIETKQNNHYKKIEQQDGSCTTDEEPLHLHLSLLISILHSSGSASPFQKQR